MNYTDDATLEKIQAYLRGELTTAEAQAFEAECAADPDLAEALALEQDLQDTLDLVERRRIRMHMEELRQQHPLPEQESRHSFRRLLWVATPLAAAAMLFLYFGFLRPPGYVRHADRYFIDSLSPDIRSLKSAQDEVQAAYRKGNYVQGLSRIQSLPDSLRDDLDIRYFEAMLQLKLEDYAAAEAILAPLADSSDAPHAALYYPLAFAKAYQGKTEAAKAQLRIFLRQQGKFVLQPSQLASARAFLEE